jgi:hypothetical protein
MALPTRRPWHKMATALIKVGTMHTDAIRWMLGVEASKAIIKYMGFV